MSWLGPRKTVSVARAMRMTSRSFIQMMIERLLLLSAMAPAGREKRSIGIRKTSRAAVAFIWDSYSNVSEGTPPMMRERVAKVKTISFQALSLKAPMNWEKSSPARGCFDGGISLTLWITLSVIMISL